MTELDPSLIKRGFWTDLDRGSVLGQTITTDTNTGTLVVAILAVLSTLATTHLWHLVTFSIHQIRANGKPTDALFRQQQVMLRTLPTPSSVIAEATKLWWAWRGKTHRPFLRSLLLAMLAVLFTAGTLAASIFSSLIVDTSDLVVLVNSPYCGWMTTENMAERAMSDTMLALAANYNTQCYGERDTLRRACSNYIQTYIGNKMYDTTCPFNQTVCGIKEAVALDSGMLDMNDDFGFNLPQSDRVRYRKKVTCSPLATKGYLDVFVYDPTKFDLGRPPVVDNEVIATLNYGPVPNRNFTVLVSVDIGEMSVTPSLAGFMSWSSPDSPMPVSWSPAPELRRDDGDVALKVIDFRALGSKTRVDDPFISLRREALYNIDTPMTTELFNRTIYKADSPMKALGCLQQYQFCHNRNSGGEFCTDLRGLPPNASQASFPDASPLQQAMLQLIVNASYTHDTSEPSPGGFLLTRYLTHGSILSHLPSDQWKSEIRDWEQRTWAATQIAMSDYAVGKSVRAYGSTGPYDGLIDKTAPVNDGEGRLCGMQRMRVSGNVVNINVFALSFIAAFSGVVTILDIFILKFLIYMSNFRRALAPRIERWIQDGVWQLQRRAYEGQGHRDWVDIENEIPTTTSDKKFKDMLITWVPGKSPAFDSSSTFETSNDTEENERSSTRESGTHRPHQGPIRPPRRDDPESGLGLSNMI